jgi:TolB protein
MMIALAACVTSAAWGAAPEGPRLAVVKWNLFQERYELETVDPTGALPLRLAGGGERKRPLPEIFEAPSWSPDGSQIAFSGVARSLEAGFRGNRVYVVGSDGKGLRRLRGTRGALQPVFTPDGSAVAFTRSWRRGAGIWLAPLAGGAPRRLTKARRGVYLLAGSFAPDGRTLVATRWVEGRALEDVVAVHLSTGKIETVVRRASQPLYSPDGTELALIRWRPLVQRDGNRTFSSDVYTSRADGSRLRRLTRTRFQDESFPSWDPSGERLAFVRGLPEPVENELIELNFGASVMQINADGSCLQEILEPSASAVYGAAWQPGPGREAGRIACRSNSR